MTGRSDLGVFFDRSAIEWGDSWRARIVEGLDSSTALIAVVSPNYLTSAECCREYEDLVRTTSATRWFLPLYYIEVDDLAERDDAASAAGRAHQWDDWRELRTSGPTSRKVRTAVEKLATRIRDLLRENESTAVDSAEPGPAPSAAPREIRAQVPAAEDGEVDWIDQAIEAQAALDDEE